MTFVISRPDPSIAEMRKEPITLIDKFHFELVQGCQLQCVGCPISTLLPKVKRTPPEVFEQCMRNVDVPGIKYLRLFNYGETLLHDRLGSIFEIILRLPHQIETVEISTNGQFAHWDDLKEVFKTQRLDELAVSCDGDGTPETYERLRPPAKWDKLMDFLEKAHSLRDTYSPGTKLVTRTICVDPEEQARWQSILEPLGFEPEIREWLVLANAAEDVSGGRTLPTGACKFMQRYNHIYANWDGTMVPCCGHPGAGDFGSLKTHKFSEITYSKPRFDMIKRMEQDRASMPICGGCGFD